MSFTDCQSDNGSAYVSKPYASTLSGQAFPLYDPTGIGSHYGDWPTEITASWKNGAGAQLEAYTTLTGAIPEFADSIHHSAPDYTATNSSGASYLAFWDGGWTRDDGVSMALGMTKSTVMTATYSSIAYPDFATLLGVLSDKKRRFPITARRLVMCKRFCPLPTPLNRLIPPQRTLRAIIKMQLLRSGPV